MKVKNDDEAIALMNDCKYGLTASLWTDDAERAAAIGARLETGTVFMNRADYLDPALCWTGSRKPAAAARFGPRLPQPHPAEILPPAEVTA